MTGMRGIWSVIWAPLGVIALHSVLAAILGHRRSLDPLFHLLGGAAGAFAVLQAIPWLRGLAPGKALRYPAAWVVVAVASIAVAWELMEFVSDRLLGTHVQVGARDTAADLVLGVAGAVLLLGLAAIQRRRGH